VRECGVQPIQIGLRALRDFVGLCLASRLDKPVVGVVR
jgi:hypothetical protein